MTSRLEGLLYPGFAFRPRGDRVLGKFLQRSRVEGTRAPRIRISGLRVLRSRETSLKVPCSRDLRVRDLYFALEEVAFLVNFHVRPLLEGLAYPGFVFHARGSSVPGKLLRRTRARETSLPGIPFSCLWELRSR